MNDESSKWGTIRSQWGELQGPRLPRSYGLAPSAKLEKGDAKFAGQEKSDVTDEEEHDTE